MSSEGICSETCADIHAQFSALSDYIWKTPRLLTAEREAEQRKLYEYFPDSTDPEIEERNRSLRTMRAHFEGVNLWLRFPTYMANSNFIIAASMFEHYLHRLCQDVELYCPAKILEQKGFGVKRLFNFLRASNLDPSSCLLYEQVDALLTLRNALVHANGELSLSRDREKILLLVKKRIFIEPVRRKSAGMIDERGLPDVSILGDPPQVLHINNFLAHRSCGYFQRFLVDLSRRIEEAVAGMKPFAA